MADEKRIAESRVTCEALAADLSQPIIIEREGQPFGVFIAYEEYKRLQAEAEEGTMRREQAWKRLDTLLADVHARTTAIEPAGVEAEITTAVEEVRAERRARSSRH